MVITQLCCFLLSIEFLFSTPEPGNSSYITIFNLLPQEKVQIQHNWACLPTQFPSLTPCHPAPSQPPPSGVEAVAVSSGTWVSHAFFHLQTSIKVALSTWNSLLLFRMNSVSFLCLYLKHTAFENLPWPLPQDWAGYHSMLPEKLVVTLTLLPLNCLST